MAVSVIPLARFCVPDNSPLQQNFNLNNLISRSGNGRDRGERNYYELLGVSVDSNAAEIKKAYRKLQKKHHPDIADHQGHEFTLRLNEAYKVLMRDDKKRDYDMKERSGRHSPHMGYSSWNGPFRSPTLFIDEHACVGCRQCMQHASKTFMMDESAGTAKVKVQYGDNEENIQVLVDSCPVNCIYWVDKEEVGVLEYLMQTLPKEGYGVFNGGWERSANVFMAAKAFTKKLKQQLDKEETLAHAEARDKAETEIKMDRLWNWLQSIWHKQLMKSTMQIIRIKMTSIHEESQNRRYIAKDV